MSVSVFVPIPKNRSNNIATTTDQQKMSVETTTTPYLFSKNPHTPSHASIAEDFP